MSAHGPCKSELRGESGCFKLLMLNCPMVFRQSKNDELSVLCSSLLYPMYYAASNSFFGTIFFHVAPWMIHGIPLQTGSPHSTVQRAVLNSFSNVFCGDTFRSIKIGNCAGDTQDPVIGAGTQFEITDCQAEER